MQIVKYDQEDEYVIDSHDQVIAKLQWRDETIEKQKQQIREAIRAIA